jgi:hypothetical protein
LLIPDTRWRIREEAVAATAEPKRRKGIAARARQPRKAEQRSLILENELVVPNSFFYSYHSSGVPAFVAVLNDEPQLQEAMAFELLIANPALCLLEIEIQ